MNNLQVLNFKDGIKYVKTVHPTEKWATAAAEEVVAAGVLVVRT